MDANTYYLNQHLAQEEKISSWIESNEESILEAYKESLTFEGVPDEFINNQWEAAQ